MKKWRTRTELHASFNLEHFLATCVLTVVTTLLWKGVVNAPNDSLTKIPLAFIVIGLALYTVIQIGETLEFEERKIYFREQ